jgi:hypothetical protein
MDFIQPSGENPAIPPQRDNKGRYLKGQGGRPKGAKNKKILIGDYSQMLAERTPEILEKVIDMALSGDLAACKILLDRSYPVPNAAMQDLQRQIDELIEEIGNDHDHLTS